MNRGRPNNQQRFAQPRQAVVQALVDGVAVSSTPTERLMAASILLADGVPRFEIAVRLNVSAKTVSRYAAQIRSTA